LRFEIAMLESRPPAATTTSPPSSTRRMSREEPPSAKTEFHSASQQTLASKEELLSLNCKLVALNVELQQTLERERGISSGLQKGPFSVDTVARQRGLSASAVDAKSAQHLVGRLGDVLSAIAGILKTLLDTDQRDGVLIRNELVRESSEQIARQGDAVTRIADLTPRERQIMALVVAGHGSKRIAAELGISHRTVENHRASIMKKTGSKSLPGLALMALAAARTEATSQR
jgi:DNA-binding CsgD family transcriptional regulator